MSTKKINNQAGKGDKPRHNLKKYAAGWDAIFGKPDVNNLPNPKITPLTEKQIKFYDGKHDMENGPCACGAWHENFGKVIQSNCQHAETYHLTGDTSSSFPTTYCKACGKLLTPKEQERNE